MIILDEESQFPLADGATTKATDAANTNPSLDAIGPESDPRPPPPPYTSSYQATEPVYPEEHYAPRESTAKRFWKAFGVAFCIWAFIFLDGMFLALRINRGHPTYRWPWPVKESDPPSRRPGFPVEWPEESDGEIGHCILGPHWDRSSFEPPSSSSPLDSPTLFSANTSFKLPVDAEELFFFSRGAFSRGSIEFVPGDGMDVEASVSASYYSDEVFKQANICLLKRDKSRIGLGIFTPDQDSRITISADVLHVVFDIQVRFPMSWAPPLTIPKLTTNLPSFSHHIGDLSDVVHFRSASLVTTESSIQVDSISAFEAEMETSSGTIEGTFRIGNALKLSAVDGSISTNISLYNRNPLITNTLFLKSTNGFVESNINLFSPSTIHKGAYSITSSSLNGSLSLTIPSLPPGLTLDLEATSTRGPASVLLHPSYEGSLSVHSFTYPPTLHVREVVVDPMRKGRERREWERKHGVYAIEGGVFWVPVMRWQDPGTVRVASTFQAHLEL
ncbi:hypothetical protein JAAARDRAFT_32327 [Jaapia argillacea MUCL 33604]|uniref:DUF7330 domain-containing protein n=1 Tax=Jaapia argillacea MUCL 33604 TaxID=933084 RepID=A0A067QCS7_9AGAM|nr:hypothetical protein JAAARDRAFT_32327 [Jaapia argillacea MUCL 33604]